MILSFLIVAQYSTVYLYNNILCVRFCLGAPPDNAQEFLLTLHSGITRGIQDTIWNAEDQIWVCKHPTIVLLLQTQSSLGLQLICISSFFRTRKDRLNNEMSENRKCTIIFLNRRIAIFHHFSLLCFHSSNFQNLLISPRKFLAACSCLSFQICDYQRVLEWGG